MIEQRENISDSRKMKNNNKMKEDPIVEISEETFVDEQFSSTIDFILPKGYNLHSTKRQYVIEKVLGKGTFGITYLANCNGKPVAIKEYFMGQFCGRDSSSMEVTGSCPGNQIEYYGKKFLTEARNLQKLSHPSVIKIYEVFEANNTYYYSMEYIDGETLDDYILKNKRLDETEAIGYLWEISKAVKYIHDNKMLHLDLKPKNIMRKADDGSLVVIDFGLSKQASLSIKDAKRYIEEYFLTYPNIKKFLDESVEFCKEHGYVTTILNRRRYIKEIHDNNYMVKEFGKRAAMNSRVQGSAADLIKIAMINIFNEIKRCGLKSKLVLQIHDELIFDVFEDEKDEMIRIIKEGMKNAMKLNVTLDSSLSVAYSWYDAK